MGPPATSGRRRVRFETFKPGKRRRMQSTDWPPEHSDAIREYYAKGMSYLQIAKAINANFNTRYSRNAVLGRSKRLGLGGCNGPAGSPDPGPVDWSSSKPEARVPYLGKPHERHAV